MGDLDRWKSLLNRGPITGTAISRGWYVPGTAFFGSQTNVCEPWPSVPLSTALPTRSVTVEVFESQNLNFALP